MRSSHYKDNCHTLAKSLSLFLFLLLLGFHNTSHGQFRGNLDLQAAHSTNVEGLDSASPDNILQPLIDLRYTLPVDRTTFTLQGRYQPNYFLKETKRSFHYGYVALTGATMLPSGTEPSTINTTIQTQDPTVSRITHILDSVSLISKRELPMSRASSISSTTGALKELLSEEGYSETMKEVILEEIEKMKNDTEVLRSKQLTAKLDQTVSELTHIAATEDDLYLSGAPLPHTDGGIGFTTSKPSSAMLVIPDDIGYNDISHYNLYVAEDLLAFREKMNAPRLSLTLESELQQNTKTYSSFSYHTIKINPNFTTNISGSLVGLHYYFTDVEYPNDTLYKYTEHRLWGDIRFEIASGLASVSSVAIGFRNNPHPFRLPLDPDNPNSRMLVAQSKFTQLALGTGFAFSAGKQTTLGLFGKLSINPNIDSVALSASANQANKFAGPLSTNTYAYDKYGGSISLQSRLPLDIDIGFTFDYEHRRYPTSKRRNQRNTSTRSDNMYYTSATIAKPFFSGYDRVIGLFTGITPIIDLTYSKLSSSVSSFSYEDFTVTLNISFDF